MPAGSVPSRSTVYAARKVSGRNIPWELGHCKIENAKGGDPDRFYVDDVKWDDYDDPIDGRAVAAKKAAKAKAKITEEAKETCNGVTSKTLDSSKPVPRTRTLSPVCPIRDECLEYALANDERWGVWGGMGPRERGKLLKIERERGLRA